MASLAAMQGNFHPMGVDERKPPFPLIEAGTSPVGIGGVLSNASAALYPDLNAAGVRAEASAKWENFRGQGPVPGLISDEPTRPQEPLYLNLYLPTHIDVDGAVVSAASVRVKALGGVLSESEVVAFLREAGAPEAWIPDLVTISFCESHHSPFAVGDSGNSLGQYQLWSGWFRAGEDPFDPLTNARVAVRVRETRGRFGGAGGWSCAGLNGIY